jgi:hypothetical protein
MFPVRARLDFSVQAIRQIFNVQGSHKFLQNAPSMEEGKLSVKQLRRTVGERTAMTKTFATITIIAIANTAMIEAQPPAKFRG